MRAVCIGLTPQILEMARFSIRARWPDGQIFSSTGISHGLEMVRDEPPDLVLMHAGVHAELSIMEGIRELRNFSEVPLMVWEDGGEVQAAKALEIGADDYMRLPIGLLELEARIAVLVRRNLPALGALEGQVVTSGDLTVNPSTHEVFLNGQGFELTPTEFRLLYVLVKNRSRVVPRRLLVRLFLEGRSDDPGSLLKKYVQRLRKKLGPDSGRPQRIENIRGVGYRYFERQNGVVADNGALVDGHGSESAIDPRSPNVSDA